MYLRFSRRSSRLSICVGVLAASASILSLAAATGALAQSATELPPLEVEAAAKKRAAKKKPTSEPQAPVTQATGAAADPEEPVVFSANRTPTDYSKVGSTVSVITEKEIDAQSQTFLQDYLRQVPGISITSTGG